MGDSSPINAVVGRAGRPLDGLQHLPPLRHQVGAQRLKAKAGDAGDVPETSFRHLRPFVHRSPGNTQGTAERRHEAGLASDQVHSSQHDVCILQVSKRSKVISQPKVSVIEGRFDCMASIKRQTKPGRPRKKVDPEVGPRILKHRLDCGYTQREFATLLGVSAGLVGQWETRTKMPGRDNLLKIARLTFTTMEFLLGVPGNGDKRLAWPDVPPRPDQIDLLRRYERLPIPARQNK